MRTVPAQERKCFLYQKREWFLYQYEEMFPRPKCIYRESALGLGEIRQSSEIGRLSSDCGVSLATL